MASARDIAWRPAVPLGHTSFSWAGLKKTGQAPRSTSSAPASSSASSAHSAHFAHSAPSAPKAAAGPPRLPVKGKRNIMITSALPYVNNVPHLGNIIGCVLSADVYSRFCKLRGYNSVYVCGTDEYGTATEIKAHQMGVTPQEICDKYHVLHRQIYEWFDIDFTIFGRTTTWQQTVIAQDIFWNVDKSKLTVEQEVVQLWCEKFGFLADRYVCGTCPKCKYDDAGGDQCDKCQTLLNAADLINPTCKLDKSQVVVKKDSRHLFLDLPNVVDKLEAFVNSASQKGKWSSNSLQTTQSWLKGGLKPRCITRDLKWGTPVPKEGFTDKVFYVWFDAPIGYISITANYTDQWEEWWKNPEDVELVQFMGKDNIPFHTVIFPSTLLATGQDWTLLHHINTTEYLNYEDGKFSKSRGVGVFGDDAMNTGIPSEVWRYYLLVNRPEQADSTFIWEDFAAKNNTELLANLGNLINRVLSFCKARFDSVVPDHSNLLDTDNKFIEEVSSLVNVYVDELEKYKLKDALKTCMKISQLGNLFTQANEPWVLIKTDQARSGTVIGLLVNLAYTLAVVLQPYMPGFSSKVCDQLRMEIPEGILTKASFNLYVRAGHKIGDPKPLFRKIEDAEVVTMRARYGDKNVMDASVIAQAEALSKGKDAKGGKDAKVKAPKEPKEQKQKEPKEQKQKEPKEQRQKEPKEPKEQEPKEPKEQKQKEPKEPKEQKRKEPKENQEKQEEGSPKESKEKGSQKESKEKSSQKESKEKSSQKEPKEKSSQKEPKEKSSQKEPKEKSSQTKEKGSQKDKKPSAK